ncbi:MAG: hypothetical protein ABGZ23_03960 [Fuerstiella sp.]|nr:hypothetical protein [Fuerstiella sp.]
MFGGAAGLLVGGFVFLFFMLGVGVGPNGQNLAPLFGLGIGTIVFAPVSYGVLGFVGGMINAFVYSIVAGMSLEFRWNSVATADCWSDYRISIFSVQSQDFPCATGD